jgi:hypothetical protein
VVSTQSTTRYYIGIFFFFFFFETQQYLLYHNERIATRHIKKTKNFNIINNQRKSIPYHAVEDSFLTSSLASALSASRAASTVAGRIAGKKSTSLIL